MKNKCDMREDLKNKIGLLLNEYYNKGVTLYEIYEILKEKMEFAQLCRFPE